MPGRDQKSMRKDVVPAYRRLERAGRDNLGFTAQAFGTAAEFENLWVAAGLMCYFNKLDASGKADLAEAGRVALATLLPEAEGPCTDIIVRLPLAVQGEAPDVCRLLAALKLKRSRRVVPYIEFAGAADPDEVTRIVGPVGGRVTVIATPQDPAVEGEAAANDPMSEPPASSGTSNEKTNTDAANATHAHTMPDALSSGMNAEPPEEDAPPLAEVPCAADEQVPSEADASIANPVPMIYRRSMLAPPQRPAANSLSTSPAAASHPERPLVATAEEGTERGLMTEHDRLNIP
ncbi:hypothetical protein [Microvirga soli]|uniref:hypothetical protein n=1 Tax=Microvirga soli TaxID=1854496 RepID=UPI00191DA2CB|nr:hypothetical protein [Microvirga soli]